MHVAKRRIRRFFAVYKYQLSSSKRLRSATIWSTTFALILLSSGFVFYFHAKPALAASYTWSQSDWSGGVDGGSNPVHPTDETGWTEYASRDSAVNVGSGNLTLTSQAGSSTQASDTDFNGGNQSQTAESGSGASGSEILATTSGSIGGWSTSSTSPGTIASNTATRTAGANGKVYVLSAGSTFYSYDTVGNTWSTLTSPGAAGTAGDDLYYPGSGDAIYYMPGGSTAFYSYSILNNSWTGLSSVPGSLWTEQGIDMTSDGTTIYAYSSSGNGFFGYSIAGGTWSTLANGLDGSGDGTAIVYPGSGDFIYRILGSSFNFIKYSISGNTWSNVGFLPAPSGPGDLIAAPGNGNIYFIPGNGTTIYIYTIGGNSWSTMGGSTLPNSLTTGAGFVSAGTGPTLYAADTGSNVVWGFTYALPYYNSGTFTSSAINLGQNSNFSTLTWSATTPTNTAIKFQVRSATSSGGLSSATWYGPTSTSDYYTSSGTTINSILNGGQYVQYKALLSTTNTLATPTLADITVNYTYYNSSGTLISSSYNAGSPANILAKMRWTRTVPAGTTVKFQMRAAPDNSGSPGTWSSWLGPDGTSGSYFTDNTGGDSVPSALKSGNNAQWFAYQTFLSTTDDSQTPTLTNTTVTYVVNAPPDFNPAYPGIDGTGVSASENSNGTVTINYSVRDIDTDTGTTTPGFITPSFEYSVNGGGSWSPITSGYLAGSDLANKVVDTNAYTTYSATWNAKSQIDGIYNTTVKVRVQANDNELANNTIKASSTAFTVDTKNPVPGGTPIQINSGATKVNTRPVTLSLSAADDSSLQEIISEDSGFAGASYQSYSASTPFTLSSGDGLKTVYVAFKDQYGNVSGAQSASITYDSTPPAVPTGVSISDISNANQGNRLFVSWNKNTESDFGSYKVYRSVNGASATLYKTINDININYLFDPGLSSSSNYAYSVKAVDDITNTSSLSSSVNATPIDVTDVAPVISSVSSSGVAGTSAVITWTTDKLSVPTVLYSSDTSYSKTVGLLSFATSQSIMLSGLANNTTYNFEVKSCDAAGLCTTSPASSFTTSSVDSTLPVISSVISSGIGPNQATVTWTTDKSASSLVEYSTTSGFATGTFFGQESAVTNHSVTLPSTLLPSTTYYYKVHSTDSSGNEAISTQNSFTTSANSAGVTPPTLTISNVATSVLSDTGITITWQTNTPGTSQIQWGTTPVLVSHSVLDSNLTTQHSVSLAKLQPNTTYYYRVTSVDGSNNQALADNNGQPYTATTESSLTNTSSLSDAQITQISQQVSAAFLQKFLSGLKDNPNIGQQVYIQAATQAANSIISAPVISGIDAQVVVGTRTAVISWVTNNPANSLVEYVSNANYNNKSSQPYAFAAGSIDESTTLHHVTLSNLDPNTQYHFQIRSQGQLGPVAYSNDATLKTLPVNPSILDVTFSSITESSVTAQWQTDVPTQTSINAEDTATGQVQVLSDKSYLANHSMSVTGLLPSHLYNLQIFSTDELGNSSKSTVIPFSTTASTSKPVVSQVDITSTLVSSTGQATQTIVSWQTDKPASSQVLYYDSGNSQNTQSTSIDTDLTLNHVLVITNFKPGLVYNIKVKSVDGSGNETTSDPFNVLTPTQDASVIGLILSNFNQIFGFLHR